LLRRRCRLLLRSQWYLLPSIAYARDALSTWSENS
jgi:hypothetical protein